MPLEIKYLIASSEVFYLRILKEIMLHTCEGLPFVLATCSTVEPQWRIINAFMFLSGSQLWLFLRSAFT